MQGFGKSYQSGQNVGQILQSPWCSGKTRKWGLQDPGYTFSTRPPTLSLGPAIRQGRHPTTGPDVPSTESKWHHKGLNDPHPTFTPSGAGSDGAADSEPHTLPPDSGHARSRPWRARHDMGFQTPKVPWSASSPAPASRRKPPPDSHEVLLT